jgi:hypothetical protein
MDKLKLLISTTSPVAVAAKRPRGEVSEIVTARADDIRSARAQGHKSTAIASALGVDAAALRIVFHYWKKRNFRRRR